MGFFSIIETFFFISLGITILLVALLVYHFKQRVSVLETKYESLFDIVTNVVKQLRNMQSGPPEPMIDPAAFHNSPQWFEQQMHLGNISMSPDFSQQLSNTMPLSNSMHSNMMNIETIIEDVDSETESEDDADSATESEDDADSDAESENDADSDAESESENDAESVSNSVKIITLPTVTDIFDINEIVELDGGDGGDGEDEIYESPLQDIQNDYSILPVSENDSIVITKLESMSVEVGVDVDVVPEKPLVNDLYKKMTLSNLKATVISKGLCSDPSKMKKNELLALLEEGL